MADHRSVPQRGLLFYAQRQGRPLFRDGRGPIQLILAAIRCSSRRKAISANRGEGLPQAEGCRRTVLERASGSQTVGRRGAPVAWP